jgi:hypothetical protein
VFGPIREARTPFGWPWQLARKTDAAAIQGRAGGRLGGRSSVRRRRFGRANSGRRLRAEFGDGLREDEPLRRRFDGPAGRWDIVPALQESNKLGVLLTREVGPDTHVCRDILVIEERPLRQCPGVMALPAVHGKDLSPSDGILKTLGVLAGPRNPQWSGASRQIDRRALTTRRHQRHANQEANETSVPTLRKNGCHRRFPFLPCG